MKLFIYLIHMVMVVVGLFELILPGYLKGKIEETDVSKLFGGMDETG